MSSEARDFVRIMDAAHKPVAAICHAPWVLVSSHLVTGKTLTSYYTLQDDIVNAGGNWVDQEVCVDDNLITSRSPQDLPAFTGKLIEILARPAWRHLQEHESFRIDPDHRGISEDHLYNPGGR